MSWTASIASFFNSLIDPLLGWLLLIHPTVAMILLTFFVTLIITLIYKYTTNQTVMKSLKEELNKGRKKIRKAKGNPQKQLEIHKGLAKTQQKYMMHSFRSMLFTFLPIIILLGWMQVHFAIEPVYAGQPLNITVEFSEGARGEVSLIAPENVTVLSEINKTIEDQQATWTVSGERGRHILRFMSEFGDTAQEEIVVEGRTVPYDTQSYEGVFKNIEVDYNKLIILNLFGWKVGWFFSYIVFSIVFSISLRKLLRVA